MALLSAMAQWVRHRFTKYARLEFHPASSQPDLFDHARHDPRTWKFRSSRRAKRLTIQVHAGGKVEVIIPAGVSDRVVSRFVAKHRKWIAEQVALSPPLPSIERPESIWLGAVEQSVAVEVVWDQGTPRYKAEEDCVKLSGPASSHLKLLQRWLKSAAQWHLAPRMRALSTRTGLSPRKVCFRLQKTRWGSYSQSGTLSLNATILLLPRELCDYVMLHELCHIQHLDHSPAFWSLLDRHCPGARQLDHALDSAQGLIPLWVYARPED